MVKGFIWGVVVTVVVALGIGLGVAYSGAYDVAASDPHNPVVRWYFKTVMRNSVSAHADAIEAPALDEATRIAHGFKEYDEHCAQCHGAPGIEPKVIGKAMRPDPPDLKETGRKWPANEIFWVIKHGVKMTGMPAWGEEMSDDRVWSVTAFVKNRLPELNADGYRQLRRQVGKEQKEADAGGRVASAHSREAQR